MLPGASYSRNIKSQYSGAYNTQLLIGKIDFYGAVKSPYVTIPLRNCSRSDVNCILFRTIAGRNSITGIRHYWHSHPLTRVPISKIKRIVFQNRFKSQPYNHRVMEVRADYM